MTKTEENRLRRAADRQGLKLQKSPRRDPNALDYGLYMITDVQTGGAIHPHGVTSPYDLTADGVRTLLKQTE